MRPVTVRESFELRHWRCGRPLGSCPEWCSMPGGCDHCGWSPCRWWCLGADRVFSGLNAGGSYRAPAWRLHNPQLVREPA